MLVVCGCHGMVVGAQSRTRNLEKNFMCLGCNRNSTRRIFDTEADAAREKHELTVNLMRSWMKKDYCEPFGTTLGRSMYQSVLL